MEGGEVRGQHSGVARVSIACSVVAAATGEKSRCTWVIPEGHVLQAQVLALRLTVALSPSPSHLRSRPCPTPRLAPALLSPPSPLLLSPLPPPSRPPSYSYPCELRR